MRGWSSETDSQTGIGGTRVGVSALPSRALSPLCFFCLCSDPRGWVRWKENADWKRENTNEISC